MFQCKSKLSKEIENNIPGISDVKYGIIESNISKFMHK